MAGRWGPPPSMPAQARQHKKLLGAAAAVALMIGSVFLAMLSGAAPATGANLSKLQSELSANSTQASNLAAGIKTLNGQISSLNSQISLVRSRSAVVHGDLAKAEAALAHVRKRIKIQHKRVAQMKKKLAITEKALADELVSRYEQPPPTLVSVVINSSGFQQMLDQLQFMKRANDTTQSIIQTTREAKAAANAATARLQQLERSDEQIAAQKLAQAHAIDGMQTLLASRQATLSHIQAARTAALQAAQSRGSQLQNAITVAKRQLQAAQQAAQQLTGSSGSGSGGTSSSGSYKGWAIPYAVVLCESGGQNLPPNGAGASGYYQIIPSTWRQYGGNTPQAYQASKAEQSAVAAKIWNGGKGASNWTCSSIVGII